MFARRAVLSECLMTCFLGKAKPTKVLLVCLVLELDVRASGQLRSIREQNWTVFASPSADTSYKRRDSGCVATHESGPVRRQSQGRGTGGSSGLCGGTIVC
jgi:hypothetical protein